MDERSRADLLSELVAVLETALPAGTPERRGGQRSVWDVLVDDLTVEDVRSALRGVGAGAGGELAATTAGNRPFCSAESSALMAVNFLAPFASRPGLLGMGEGRLTFEHELRVTGVRSRVGPTPDVTFVSQHGTLVFEAKTAEPWRHPPSVSISTQYDRPATSVSDDTFALLERLRSSSLKYDCLDAAQLLKHLLGTHSALTRGELTPPTSLVLFYWRPADAGRFESAYQRLAAEIDDFARHVSGQAVQIVGLSSDKLLEQWSTATAPEWLRNHAAQLRRRYFPGKIGRS